LEEDIPKGADSYSLGENETERQFEIKREIKLVDRSMTCKVIIIFIIIVPDSNIMYGSNSKFTVTNTNKYKLAS